MANPPSVNSKTPGSLADTQPSRRVDPLAETRYHHILKPKRSRRWKMGVRIILFISASLVALLLVYLLAPARINILLLGIDARPGDASYGRSDTMILGTINPLRPYVGALSIPRDLWVDIPGQGKNRINTAHFFAELDEIGTGPQAAMEVVEKNFNIHSDHYIRVRFDGFKEFVDALGGIDVTLPRSMSGYTAGVHHLDGDKALALVRDRQGSDDFFRMERGQLLIKALIKLGLSPTKWPRLPAALIALVQTVYTDIPGWQFPRIALALLRAGPEGIDSRSITRDMVNPVVTPDGAMVLEPNWEAINPVLADMFGQ